MQTLYSPEVREFIHTRDWPSGLKFEIVEFEDPAPHLKIIFYRDNWITLDFQAQMRTTEVVKEVMHKMELDGIPMLVDRIRHEFSED